jgi:hypothetical protein
MSSIVFFVDILLAVATLEQTHILASLAQRNNRGQTELTRVFRTLLNGDNSQGGVRWETKKNPPAPK